MICLTDTFKVHLFADDTIVYPSVRDVLRSQIESDPSVLNDGSGTI